MAEKFQNRDSERDVYRNLVEIHFLTDEFEKGEKILEKLKTIALDEGEKEEEARCYYKFGVLYEQTGMSKKLLMVSLHKGTRFLLEI